MNRKLINASFVALLSLSSTAFAHDGVVHKGKPVHGKATKIEAAGFKVKTEEGEKTIEINKDTVFEIGTNKGKGIIQDLKDGASVMVEGTTLESGVMVATEVLIHSETGDHAPKTHGQKSH